MEDTRLTDIFLATKLAAINGRHAINKPILLLIALGRCHQKQSRLASFLVYEDMVNKASGIVGQNINALYPFGRLVGDGIWELDSATPLSLTSSGDLRRTELIEKKVTGGLTNTIYNALTNNKTLLFNIGNQILQRYFPVDQHAALRLAVGLPQTFEDIHGGAGQVTMGEPATQLLTTIQLRESALDTVENGFIAYLNSLHNLGADGANALAESQALNRYFGALYEPFPLIAAVLSALQSGRTDRVVVLTGHAGDGKSTIAVDVLKRLRGLPLDEPLPWPPNEREEISGLPEGAVTIVKDVSELSAQTRLQWLEEAFSQPGSWLLVSNTGPLLNSFREFAEQRGQLGDLENELLAKLDAPYAGGALDRHTLSGRFDKDLVIFNLTRLDNVDLAARVLGKMLNHPAWSDCASCSIVACCPLQMNRRALLQVGADVLDRVRWIYQRLTHYEQRLTLRQMVAHLALSLTGGMGCAKARQSVEESIGEGKEKGIDGLAGIVFSEGFFGFRQGKPWVEAEGLRAVALARRLPSGGPIAVDYDRQLTARDDVVWADLPDDMAMLAKRRGENAGNASGVSLRFSLRRLLYIFGRPVDEKSIFKTERFIDAFLQSPWLRDFDRWQRENRLTLSRNDQKKLTKACLRVLLECYSGFSSGQFHSHDRLYLTLRRTDRAIAQPTQLVVATLLFEDFGLDFDLDHRLPLLSYREGKAVLKLGLPLLDYIQSRDRGELGGELGRIHWAQLETFRAELLREVGKNRNSEEIALLRAGIDGQVNLHRFLFDPARNSLEVDD